MKRLRIQSRFLAFGESSDKQKMGKRKLKKASEVYSTTRLVLVTKVVKEDGKVIETLKQKEKRLDVMLASGILHLCNSVERPQIGVFRELAKIPVDITLEYVPDCAKYGCREFPDVVSGPAIIVAIGQLQGGLTFPLPQLLIELCNFYHVPHGQLSINIIESACTEMIMATDGNDEKSIFPASQWNYTDRATYCQDAYGIDPRPNWITTEFGGHDIKRVLKRFGSNIIFFNGLRDPWSGGGVLKSISKTVVAIVAKEGAHHVDLRFSSKEDPEWLEEIRRKEIKIIHKWLTDYYHDL